MENLRQLKYESPLGASKVESGGAKGQGKENRVPERRREMIIVPSSKSTNSNTNHIVTHKIQVVRDVGARPVPRTSGTARERQTAPCSNNITLTFGHIEEDVDTSIESQNLAATNPMNMKRNNHAQCKNIDFQYLDNETDDLSVTETIDEEKKTGAVDECDVGAQAEENTELEKQKNTETCASSDTKMTNYRKHATFSKQTPMSRSESTKAANKSQVDELAFGDPRQNQVFHMLTEVQKLRKSDMFSDTTVRVRDQEFRCHKFILACNSPFLKTLISEAEEKTAEKVVQGKDGKTQTTDDGGDNGKAERECGNSAKDVASSGDADSETTENKDSTDGDNANEYTTPSTNVEITLRGIKPDIFAKILDFLYCVFDDVITENSAMELLLAADTFQLKYLSRTCANYVTDTLSPGNVFDVITLWDTGCSRLFEPKVVRRCHEVIREHFRSLSQSEEFLTLGRHHMIPLVADSMLHVDSEMLVLQALLRWVQFRPAERTSDMTLMLQHIRFPLMTSQELDKLAQVTLLKENSLAMALIEESRAYGGMDYNERLAWPRQNCISRCQFPCRDFILWTADRDKGLHLYSIIDGQHHKVTKFVDGALGELSTGHFSFDSTSSVCCYGARIFFTGGEFSTDMTWSVDTATGEVRMHAKMPRGRKFHSMVAARGCLYCLGGQDKRGYTVLDSVDAYVMEKDVWIKVGHLSVPAYNMAAVVSGGAIYLVGGADQAGQPLRLVQCFIALRSGLYSAFKIEMDNMPPSLLSARAVTSGFDGLVYIVCGHGEVYKFEPEKRHLSHLTTLENLAENPRVRFGLAHVGGCLVVIGGHQLGRAMQEPIRSVCLDIASKTEVRDYSPMLPGDIINTCLSVKLNSNTLNLFE